MVSTIGLMLGPADHRRREPAWSDHQTGARLRAMAYPNTLIFVDFPSTDPEATGRFYAEVFGWEVEGRPAGAFHRIVPGQNFQLARQRSAVGVGNLHMGIYDVNDGRPNPRARRLSRHRSAARSRPAGVHPRLRRRQARTASSTPPRSSAPRSCGATTTGASSTASAVRSSIRGAPRSSCGARPATIRTIPEGFTSG